MKVVTKHTSLLAAALLSIQAPLFAGQAVAIPTVAAEHNPLSFLDGKLVFDLQERVRVEARENNFDFDNDNHALTDDSWLLQRFRIGLKAQPVSWLTLYAQGQDSREWQSARPDYPGVLGAEGDDSFDLHQGYVEIGNLKQFPLTLKVGRQVLAYGDERLIGASDWNNLARTFDAVKFHFEQPLWWVDAFASSVVVPRRGWFNQSDFVNGNETQRQQVFSGVYLSTAAIPVQTTDFYVLQLHENAPGSAADTNFFTTGMRIKSKPGVFAAAVPADGKAVTPLLPKAVGWDYDAEAAFQSGKLRGLDLTAYAVHAGFGYTLDVPWKLRIGAEYNYASGDNNPTDGNSQTFQNLFPTNHKFYGTMDLESWQNMHNPAISLKFIPTKNVTVQLDGHVFWLASNEDAWYRANGTTRVRPINPNADSYIGSELDFNVTWKPLKQLAFQAGYSHFWAGDYLKATGRSDDADFGYVQSTVEF